MSVSDRMASVVASLDWEGDLGEASLLDPVGELLRSRHGEGALRWVTGAVEASLSGVQDEIQDTLAPRPLFRFLTQAIAVDVLFDLAGDDTLPAELRVIDPQLPADFVGRGVELADVTGGLRRMQRDWLVWLTEAALAADADAGRLVPDIAASVTTTMDAWVEAMTEAIVDRRRQVAQAGEVRVRATIESVIAAEPVDVSATSALLRVPLAGWHRCCAVGASAGVIVDRAKIDVTARSLGRWAGVDHLVRYETSRGKTYLWVSTGRTPGAIPPEVLEVPPPLVVGVGEPNRGADGFRRSFVEADDTLRLALRAGIDGVRLYRDEALAIALSQDEERCRWFVEHELGDLARDSEEMAENRDALRAFFAARMRIAPAAEELFVHRNTLIHRLERIETILGHPLGERAAEVQAALKVAELYPPSEPEGSSA